MRRLVRRSELVPEKRRSAAQSGASGDLSRDDREFLDLLKRRHRKQKYAYMKQWWEKEDRR
jgi:hypothetical protein